MTSQEFAQAVVNRLNELLPADDAIVLPVEELRDCYAAVVTNPAQKPWIPYDDILAAQWFTSSLPRDFPEGIASNMLNDIANRKTPNSRPSLMRQTRLYLAAKAGQGIVVEAPSEGCVYLAY